jgi:ribose transport system permease protein
VGAVYLSGTSGSPADIAVTCGLGIAAATGLGLVNGLVVAVLRISPFVATLGMLGVGGGLMLLITNGADVVVPASISSLGNGVWFDWVPVVVLIAAVLCLIVDHVLRRTSFGTHTYAIGSDREAARRAGINLSGHLIAVYTLSGFLSGIAGVLILARNVVG